MSPKTYKKENKRKHRAKKANQTAPKGAKRIAKASKKLPRRAQNPKMNVPKSRTGSSIILQ